MTRQLCIQLNCKTKNRYLMVMVAAIAVLWCAASIALNAARPASGRITFGATWFQHLMLRFRFSHFRSWFGGWCLLINNISLCWSGDDLVLSVPSLRSGVHNQEARLIGHGLDALHNLSMIFIGDVHRVNLDDFVPFQQASQRCGRVFVNLANELARLGLFRVQVEAIAIEVGPLDQVTQPWRGSLRFRAVHIDLLEYLITWLHCVCNTINLLTMRKSQSYNWLLCRRRWAENFVTHSHFRPTCCLSWVVHLFHPLSRLKNWRKRMRWRVSDNQFLNFFSFLNCWAES